MNLGDSLSLQAFDAECSAFAEHLDSLSNDDLVVVTNCPPWTVHELVVHVVFSITLPERFPAPPSTMSLATAADYYRRPERNTAEYRSDNVERTRSIAATVDPSGLADFFRSAWKRASVNFGAYDADDRIHAGRLALTVDAYLLTRLMSVATHGIDVAITTSAPAWTTEAARHALRPVLADLLGGLPPRSWTDQDLLELGTGRRQLTDEDREALGERVAAFPLLS